MSTDPQLHHWHDVNDIASLYEIAHSAVRKRMRVSVGRLGSSDRGEKFREARGRRGASYRSDFVTQVFGAVEGSKPGTRRQKGRRLNGVVHDVMDSRRAERPRFSAYLEDLFSTEGPLYMRCMTGSDLFNTNAYETNQLLSRANSDRESSVVLLYPYGDAARARGSAEGEPDAERSQLRLNSESSKAFIHLYRDRLNLDVRWVDDTLQSYLVWSEEFAIVEPYDFGRSPDLPDGFGCIGRSAPVMVIEGGCEYHQLLKSGFMYLWERHERRYTLDSAGELEQI